MIFYFDPDFEAELAAWPGAHVPGGRALAAARRLAPAVRPIAGPGGVVIGRHAKPEERRRALAAVMAAPERALGARGIADWPASQSPGFAAWGASPSAAAVAAELGLACDFPPVEVVRRVNSKAWSHAVERELGVALPGAAVVRSEAELARAVAAAGAPRWVAKAPFGVAGRERVLGQEAALSEQARRTAARLLAREGALVYEPWTAVTREVGVQIDVERSGEVRIRGITESVVDAAGHYLGSRFGTPIEEDLRLDLSPAREVGRRLAHEGYFGPAGIDAFFWRAADGIERLRPIVEVNARHTMGMVALALRDRLPPGAAGAWLLLPPDRVAALRVRISQRVEGAAGASASATSGAAGATTGVAGAMSDVPGATIALAGGPAVLVAAPDRATLRRAEEALLGKALP